MMLNPKISVVMSVYNDETFLEDSIKSILEQTFSDFEFIIINDCSTDTSYDIISRFQDERIKILENEHNIGLTRSLNIAIKVAKGEYIARQDADDISLPNRFEKQIFYLDNNPEIALLGTSIHRINGNGHILREVKSVNKPSFKDFLESNHIKHGSSMFRRAIFMQLGGYNELFRYSQDYELWLRFAESYDIRNLLEPLYQLRIHNQSIGYTKIEETRLYCQLARKLIKKEITSFQVDYIKKKGIKQVYNYLNQEELLEIKKRIHEIRSGILVQEGDMKAAREEYKNVFRLEPLNLMNIINLIRSFFGKSFMYKTSSLFDLVYNQFKKN